MSATICDHEDMVIHEAATIEDAVGWWNLNGENGDYLLETGELMKDVAWELRGGEK